MSSPAVSAASLRKALRCFRRNQRGSSAVEFAIIAPIFFALLFAIIETAVVFFAGQVLETGTLDSARLIFTGSSASGTKICTEAQFRTDFCPRVAALFSDCSKIDLELKVYPPNTTIAVTDPIVGGNYAYTPVWQMPTPNYTVVVRAFNQWPLIVTGLGYNIANIGRGSTNKRLLAATAAFHIEPGAPTCP